MGAAELHPAVSRGLPLPCHRPPGRAGVTLGKLGFPNLLLELL